MTDLGAILFRAMGYTSRRVPTRAGDVRIFEGSSRGSLPTIALIHGLSGDAAGYLPLLQRLRRHARVVAIDLPGHGGSGSKDDLTLASCVAGGIEALASYLDEPAIVFGNSLGGLTAIRFALTHPDRVRGLFVASPAGAPSTQAELDELLAKFHIHKHADGIRFIELLLHDKPGPLRHLIARDLVRRHRAPSLRTLLRDVPNAKPFEPSELARLERIPTYFLWGRSERILPPSHLAFFKSHLQNATIEEPYGFGHSPHLDSVTDTARRVIAFAHDH
jgi:pyruvate dehydrogenase E2 component (dihydrolipoamide acetyltransferase)